MGGLLNSARKFFQGMTPAPLARAQTFAVTCSEGHRLTGQRTEGYQALRCPTCGEGLFVLPRSPLPEPVAPSGARGAEGGRRAAVVESPWADDPVPLRDPPPSAGPERPEVDEPPEADAEIEWVDDGPAAPPSPKESPEDLAAAEIAAESRAERAATPRKGEGRKGRTPAPERAEPAPEPRAPAVPLGERLRRNRNPLIFMGVALVVAATVGVRSWRARLQELPHIAERGRVEGLVALDEGRFDQANQLLSEAKRAVQRLGGEFEGASAIVQGADEAAILTGLCPDRLEDLLDEAARADPKEWAKRFDTLYKGRSILVDSRLRSVPDGQGRGRYDLDYRIFRDGEGGVPTSQGRIDLTGFRLFELIKPREGDPVKFGARLASFRFDLDANVWLVGLEPDSGVIMTHEKALESILGPPDDVGGGGEDRP